MSLTKREGSKQEKIFEGHHHHSWDGDGGGRGASDWDVAASGGGFVWASVGVGASIWVSGVGWSGQVEV